MKFAPESGWFFYCKGIEFKGIAYHETKPEAAEGEHIEGPFVSFKVAKNRAEEHFENYLAAKRYELEQLKVAARTVRTLKREDVQGPKS